MRKKEKPEQALNSGKKHALAVLDVFRNVYPNAECALNHKNPFELLIATILSAQCTDARVNMVTPALFGEFPDAQSLSRAKLKRVEELIQSTGFYKNKAKSLVECSKALVEKFGGEVPKRLEDLVGLRGVGRKTANVILGNAFGIPGLVVDTHVGRLSRRLGFTDQTDPVKVEQEMMALIPRRDWIIYSHLLISHGRARCTARAPDCAGCEVKDLCPQVGVSKSRLRTCASSRSASI